MPEITRETVKKIARLANIKLSEDETSRFAEQLEKILEYIHTLNRLDTTGIPQTVHALPMHNVWREDRVLPGLTPEEALAAAPDSQDQYFRVPRILE